MIRILVFLAVLLPAALIVGSIIRGRITARVHAAGRRESELAELLEAEQDIYANERTDAVREHLERVRGRH